MGLKTTNENFDELISSYIDGQHLSPEDSDKIESAFKFDEVFNKKYRSELLTKNFLSSRLNMVDVPSETFRGISNSIQDLINSAAHRQPGYEQKPLTFFQHLKEFFITPAHIGSFPVPKYAFAVLLIGALLIFSLITFHSHDVDIVSGSESSVMVQAMGTFHKLLDGEITPDMKSNSAIEVKRYLKQKANFDPYVPALSDYELLGCMANDYEGQKLAHVIYKSGNDMIYIYQTEIGSNQKNKLVLPDQVSLQDLRDKYYLCKEMGDHDCSMMMWYINNVLCAGVSNIPQQKLYAKFTSLK